MILEQASTMPLARHRPDPQPAPLERLLLRVSEAATLTGIGRSKAYELVASGEWPSVTIGRSVRVPLAGLRTWIAQREQSGRGHQGW
jgi:excisionase family DNA binding protein